MKDWFLWVFYIGEAVNSKAVCKIIDNENNDKAFDNQLLGDEIYYDIKMMEVRWFWNKWK